VDRRKIAGLLALPVAWFVVQLVEFAVAVWVARLLAPDSWPPAVAILAVLIGGFTIVNLRVRRRFPTEDRLSGDVPKT
jgi:hypothetical protein